MVAVTMARIATPTTTAVTAASLMCADYADQLLGNVIRRAARTANADELRDHQPSVSTRSNAST
jgi:hypothetical protein